MFLLKGEDGVGTSAGPTVTKMNLVQNSGPSRGNIFAIFWSENLFCALGYNNTSKPVESVVAKQVDGKAKANACYGLFAAFDKRKKPGFKGGNTFLYECASSGGKKRQYYRGSARKGVCGAAS